MAMLLTEFKTEDEYKALLKSKEYIAEFKRDGNYVELTGDIKNNLCPYTFHNRKGDMFTKDIDDKIMCRRIHYSYVLYQDLDQYLRHW